MKQGKANPGGPPARAVAYYRHSRDRHGNALDDQRDQVREFASERGIAIVDEFADVGKPAHDRPALRVLMDEVVRRDDFQLILCLDESRFLRFQDLDLLSLCRKHGKQLTFSTKSDVCPGRPA